MSKALMIITLDFFVMLSIVFFVLQYIQPSSDVPVISSADTELLNVVVDRDAFYQLKNVANVELAKLVKLGVALFSGGQEISDEDVTAAETFDGLSIAVRGGHEVDRIVVYPRQILSIEYAQSASKLVVTGKGGSGEAALDILHSPLVDIALD